MGLRVVVKQSYQRKERALLTEKSIEQLREGLAALHMEETGSGDAREAIENLELEYQGAVGALGDSG